VSEKIDWLIFQWNKIEALPKISRDTTRVRILENRWVRLAVQDMSRGELLLVLVRYAEIRTDPQARFYDGYKKWDLLKLFSRKKGEHVDNLLEEKWECHFERFAGKEREIPIGGSDFGGYVPKTGLDE